MGTPVYDDPTLFEFLILETFRVGLSWITILNKGKLQNSF
jgi:DNA-3-methyladenine glycosylase I